ncbi:uncharacterized protein LOC143277958 [Babylonia areolata]|uniref:uncharacterized protein LOC143277958 n=1 Tax=Babylonia areolata TaxID=304850 RepID=UPI003FD66C25
MSGTAWWLLALWGACCMPGAEGHGRMLLPPSRPTAWRLGFDSPVNYDDNQQYCGGRAVHKKFGYKCGICGDPWQPSPRPYERPDGALIMKENFVLSTYITGSVITASIQITASHLGYFEFYLCNVDELPDPVEATHDCLHRHLLRMPSEGGATRYTQVSRGVHEISLQLPAGLVCHHCVLQWKYKAGNDWHYGCKGCGPQEEFYSCADLSVTRQDGSLPTRPTPAATTTQDPYHYVPVSLRPAIASPSPPGQNETQRDPPTEAMLRFFLCTFCVGQLLGSGELPQVCVGKVDSVRACPRSLP